MLNLVAPQTRLLLVRCRCLAMQGELRAAPSRIDGALAIHDATKLTDSIAITLLKAELQYLDCHEKEAFDLIDNCIKTAPLDTPAPLLFVLRGNRSEAGFGLFHQDSALDFYRLADEQQIAGFHLFNAAELVAGEEAAANGEHFKALPIFWRELE